jgi:fibrillarin-like pre-rRNA processing protein
MAQKIENSGLFEVYKLKRGKQDVFATKSIAPGHLVYGEDIIKQDGCEYRVWDPWKSKLGAAIVKGSPNIGLRRGDVVLYLGCSTGTTVSHVSDIVGNEGLVFAVDSSARVLRDLVYLSERRKNICPILCDANNSDELKKRICMVDYIFQDIAQRDQAKIFLKNCKKFLRDEGYAVLAVKARSVNVSLKPKDVFKDVREAISKDLVVIDNRKLQPHQKDHILYVCKKKDA